MKNNMPETFSKISVKWQSDSPFFAEFLLRICFSESEEISTIGITIIDNRLNVFYSKDFIESLDIVEIEAILLHEILHIVHKFQERLGSRDHKIFNIAQDACINDTIEKTTIGRAKLRLPSSGVRMKDIYDKGYKGPTITEAIYDFLEENADKISINESSSPGEISDGLNTSDDHSYQKELTEVEKQAIEEIVNNAKMREYGIVSGNLVSEIDVLIKTKQIPWRRKLAILMSRYTNDPGDIYESTWSKRNRRGIPLPGIRKLSKKITISIDTSGSVDQDQLSMFFMQIEKIIKDYSSVTLIQWDTEVNKVQKYSKGQWKNIKIVGRGGTDVQCVYDYVNKNVKDTTLLVNFTDGYFNWDINHYNIKTIWALTSNGIDVKFGSKVYIEKETN